MKRFQKGMAMALALVFAFTLCFVAQPQVKAQAATTSVTMYVGESIYWTNYQDVKSCSASKKNIVSAKRDSKNKTHLNITAKKTGSVTLTIKTARQTQKLKIKVVKFDFSVEPVKDLGNGYIVYKITNNTGLIFDYGTMSYTLKNPEGETVKEDTKLISDLMPEKPAYVKINYDDRSYTVDPAQSSAEMITGDGTYRRVDATYKNRSNKVTITDEITEDNKLSVKFKNTYSDSVSGTIDVLLYDDAGELVDVRQISVFLKGKATDTESVTLSSVEFASYKLNVRIYSKK